MFVLLCISWGQNQNWIWGNFVYIVYFCCQITDKTDRFYIDGEDVKQSNWLRYVNCARTKQEQNCEAFQYRGQIYYKTLREITVGECVNAAKASFN